MSQDRLLAWAALCVSALLLSLALPVRTPDPTACDAPRESLSRNGWTLKAQCSRGSAELRPVRGPARRLFDLPLDLNRASPSSLETLPGIGSSRAAAIAEARSKQPFCELADLERVSGIGPRTIERLSGLLKIEAFACTGR